ncbi:hypothetical protein [Rhodanobacter sp. Root480]|uniref:hypothetical protein n=1 Tax=Rhodanobacter sp. Root480 TaxID=1736542 RepID=UPI0012E3674D|nr:hypothetical protein [Rhodanobacter sp. Root480]
MTDDDGGGPVPIPRRLVNGVRLRTALQLVVGPHLDFPASARKLRQVLSRGYSAQGDNLFGLQPPRHHQVHRGRGVGGLKSTIKADALAVSPGSPYRPFPFLQRVFPNMKKRRAITFSALFTLLAVASLPVTAGVYTDDLSKCLVSKTTPEQKGVLVNWMFSAMSLNPSVAKFVTLPDAQRKAFNVDMAKLFESLVTVTCKSEMQLAVRYEGNTAIGAAFTVLGQVAGRELFSNPEVAKGMSDLERYLDNDKIKAALNPAK